MVGVVNCPPPFVKVVSCKTPLKRSHQGPYQAVWVSRIARSNQILPWQPWFWAGRFRHGGGGCQGCHRPSTIVVLCTNVPIPTYVRSFGIWMRSSASEPSYLDSCFNRCRKRNVETSRLIRNIVGGDVSMGDTFIRALARGGRRRNGGVPRRGRWCAGFNRHRFWDYQIRIVLTCGRSSHLCSIQRQAFWNASKDGNLHTNLEGSNFWNSSLGGSFRGLGICTVGGGS